MQNLVMNEEIWMDISGYEGIYRVSNYGRIKILARQLKSARFKGAFTSETYKRQRLNPVSGYMYVDLSKKGKTVTRSVHRLVAGAFLGSIPAGIEVNHIDMNKQNNLLSNLELVTPKENTQHCISIKGHVGSEYVKVRVKSINPKTGEIIFYESMSEAQRLTGAFVSNIASCVNGRAKTAKGLKFEKV